MNGLIFVIVFVLGLLFGLKLEYKNKEDIDNILDENVKNYYTNEIKEESKNKHEVSANELTPEIIDEWLNGGENK